MLGTIVVTIFWVIPLIISIYILWLHTECLDDCFLTNLLAEWPGLLFSTMLLSVAFAPWLFVLMIWLSKLVSKETKPPVDFIEEPDYYQNFQDKIKDRMGD